MEYKYVIGGSKADYYLVSYADVIEKCADVFYAPEQVSFSNRVVRWIYDHHFSPNINRILPLPLKSAWNGIYLKNPYKSTDKICFVLFGRYLEFVPLGLVRHLRKKYPGCKVVCFLQDLVNRIALRPKNIPPEKYNEIFDLVISFDQQDCAVYGFTYYPLVYSYTEVEEDPAIEESDVYFVGKAKDRLADILAAYEKFREAGLKCDFHITGVPEDMQKYKNEIDYCTQMPYNENLKRINKTKCMLEIMQGGGRGYTLRYCEAITYNRKMITNNPEIKKAPFYRPEYISVFASPEDIQPAFIYAGAGAVDYQYREKLSPKELLCFIDCYFAKKK